jgi:site-specific recombinase XerD
LINALQRKTGKENGENIYTCTSGALNRKVNRFLKDKLGVDHSSHDFRHSKVTDLLNEGVHLKKVATYVGHSNTATTLRYFNVD